MDNLATLTAEKRKNSPKVLGKIRKCKGVFKPFNECK